jgi:hypothetical protein
MAHYTPSVHVGANEVCHVRATEASGTDLTITPDGAGSGTTLTADGTGTLPGFIYSGGGQVYIKTSTGMHPQQPDRGSSSSQGSYKHLSAAAAIQMLKTGRGVLRRVVVNTAAASSVITLDDTATTGGAGAGTHLAVIDGASKSSQSYDLQFTKGLALTVSGGNPDVTVVFD